MVEMKGTWKRERTFHVKKWNTATENVHFATEGEEGEETEEEDIPEWRA